MDIRRRIKSLPGLVIDPHNHIPVHAQLKTQIKFACTYHGIGRGDVLPSIRALAEQLGVGAGDVRRVYRELCEAGFLVTEHRKHIVVTPGSLATSESEALRHKCTEQCERLIAWARDHHLSAIALSRLLLERALMMEADSPSYVFVDVCRLAAKESASKVAKAWDIRVEGVSVGDFANLSSDKALRASTVLVNQFLYEDVLAAIGETTRGVFSVRMRVDERLQRRIRRLPAKSRVLVVLPDDAFRQTGGAVVRQYESLFGKKWRFDAKPAGPVRDLTALASSQRYQLVLLSPAVWGQAPIRLKRSSGVDRALDEPDPQSLEETRIAAGVLM